VTHLGNFTYLPTLPSSALAVLTGLSVPGGPGGILVTGAYYSNYSPTATTLVSFWFSIELSKINFISVFSHSIVEQKIPLADLSLVSLTPA